MSNNILAQWAADLPPNERCRIIHALALEANQGPVLLKMKQWHELISRALGPVSRPTSYDYAERLTHMDLATKVPRGVKLEDGPNHWRPPVAAAINGPVNPQEPDAPTAPPPTPA